MTALVSLLFIAMIPIDYKITIFSLHLVVCFFGFVFAYAHPVAQYYRQRRA